MLAPVVVVLMVTVIGVLPPVGLNVGVETWVGYRVDLTVEVVQPLLKAIALRREPGPDLGTETVPLEALISVP